MKWNEINEWMNEWLNEWMNEWVNEWMNEWIELPNGAHDPGREEKRKSHSSRAGANKKQKLSSGKSDPMTSGFSVSPDNPNSDVLLTDDEAGDIRAANKWEAMISGFARILWCTGVVSHALVTRGIGQCFVRKTLLVASLLQCVCVHERIACHYQTGIIKHMPGRIQSGS